MVCSVGCQGSNAGFSSKFSFAFHYMVFIGTAAEFSGDSEHI